MPKAHFRAPPLQVPLRVSPDDAEAAPKHIAKPLHAGRRPLRASLDSVFSRFRDQLIKQGIDGRLFSELDRRLEIRNLIIKKGALVDAIVIEVTSKKPLKNENGTAGKSTVDLDTDQTKKGGKYLFGYKAHVGAAQGRELI